MIINKPRFTAALFLLLAAYAFPIVKASAQTGAVFAIRPLSAEQQQLHEAAQPRAPAAATAVLPIQRPKWSINKGQAIHLAITDWAQHDGWTLIWYPTVSWKAISDVQMKGHKDVVSAISEVVDTLRNEGKSIQLRVSDGNNVMEVLSTEVKND